MPAVVARRDGVGWRLEGAWLDAEVADRFLAHLVARAFSPATIRAYAYDLVNFGRFCAERGVRVTDAVPGDLFDYLDWQQQPTGPRGARVVPLAARRPAAATARPPAGRSAAPRWPAGAAAPPAAGESRARGGGGVPGRPVDPP